MNLESHGCGDETVILLIEDIEHSVRTTILDVSIAAQFNAIGGFGEDECSFLEGHASSEFTIKKAEFSITVWSCGCVLDSCQ